MRVLVVYSSNVNQIAIIADQLACQLRDLGIPTDTFDVSRNSASEIAIDAYDAVVFGSPSQRDGLDPRIAWCLNEYLSLLLEMPSAFFTVVPGMLGMSELDQQKHAKRVARNLQDLRWKPSITQCFAGSSRKGRQGRFPERLRAWFSRPAESSQDSEIDSANQTDIARLADRFAAFIRGCKQTRHHTVIPALMFRPYSVFSNS